MTNLDIAHQRLQNQFLLQSSAESPTTILSHLLAVQAQEYALSLWGMGATETAEPPPTSSTFPLPSNFFNHG